MSSTPDNLLRDPLFQLNVVLWLTQPLPSGGNLTPLFYQSGFSVYAIAPALGVPPDVRLSAQAAGVPLNDAVRPDVLLAHEIDRKFAFSECKAASFGPESSTAQQAKSLLLVSGPRAADVLGLTPSQVVESLLILFAPWDQCGPLAGTFSGLRDQLLAARLPAGESSIVGLALDESKMGIVLEEQESRFFGVPTGFNGFIACEPGTDPRPLYFIPFDPDVNQSAEEKAFGRRVLFERMQSTIISAIGRACPPCEVPLECEPLLNDAMFGMYGQWENQDSSRCMRRLCREFVEAIMRAVNGSSPGVMTINAPGYIWKVTLETQEQSDSVLDALARFSCETLDLKAAATPTLFDDLEDRPEQPTGQSQST